MIDPITFQLAIDRERAGLVREDIGHGDNIARLVDRAIRGAALTGQGVPHEVPFHIVPAGGPDERGYAFAIREAVAGGAASTGDHFTGRIGIGTGPTVATSRARLLEAIAEIHRRATHFDWDGAGGQSVSPSAVAHARRIARALPVVISTTEIDVDVDPDGEISISWYGAPGVVLTLSIGPNGRMSWAGAFGAARSRGQELYTGAIPPEFLSSLRRLDRSQALSA